MKFNRKPSKKRQSIKARVKVGRLHSGNTITALKYLRKLDKLEEEKKKNGANGIESKQASPMVSLCDGESRSL